MLLPEDTQPLGCLLIITFFLLMILPPWEFMLLGNVQFSENSNFKYLKEFSSNVFIDHLFIDQLEDH